MIKQLREQYNQAFSEAKYKAFIDDVIEKCGDEPTFRVAETPVFVPFHLKNKLLTACEDIVNVLTDPDFKNKSEGALHSSQIVPNEDDHTLFLQLDFGICKDEDGVLVPQLIELQGFPSLYFFQSAAAECYRMHFPVPPNFDNFFNGLNKEKYIELLRQSIVGDEKPESVILLEIEPHKQNTKIDFYATARELGIKILCLSELKKDGLDLYYLNEQGKRIDVRRIYNRIIFDELEKRNDLYREFDFTQPVNATWVGHPNWFSRISKYTLPSIKSDYVPPTYFLDQLESYPADLHNYVLKPIFSFSGMGVKINISQEDIENIPIEERHNFILQKKVRYADIIQTPSEAAKCEIRMMFLWPANEPKPLLINNLVRLSKGEMVGVRYNKNKDWVGGSVAFFEP
ncbi:MAG: hypothetical protein KA010_01545 [Saprospiraceae bacterium]|nr:hypothetical protein [Saprospiraceae bacterium]